MPISDDKLNAALEEIIEGDPALQKSLDEKLKEIDDGHLVELMNEFHKESSVGLRDRMRKDKDLWDAHESMDEEKSKKKEDWQSSIVLSLPFTTIQQAKGIVREGINDLDRAFTIKEADKLDRRGRMVAHFWRGVLMYILRSNGEAIIKAFVGATEMGLSVGLSQSVKLLHAGDGEVAVGVVHPSNIFYDPKRRSGDVWGGMYSIHVDTFDLYELKRLGQAGEIVNADLLKGDEYVSWDSSGTRLDKEDAKKELGSNKFRKRSQTREYWGVILDENGDEVVPSGSFTVVGDTVIRRAVINNRRQSRWPWVDFAPIPNLIKYHGYGLYEGVMPIWKTMNSLMDSMMDSEAYRINPMYDFYPDRLLNSTDRNKFPGKLFVHVNGSDGPALVPIMHTLTTFNDFARIIGFLQDIWDNGTLISEIQRGAVGRRDITAREVEIKSLQGSNVFRNNISKEIESGFTSLLRAIIDLVLSNWENPAILDRIFGADDELLPDMKTEFMRPKDERFDSLGSDIDLVVNGVSGSMKRVEDQKSILGLIEIAKDPNTLYNKYLKHFESYREFAESSGVGHLVKTDTEVKTESVSMFTDSIVTQAMQGVTGGPPSALPPDAMSVAPPVSSIV